MVQIHELTLGSTFDDLLVEVYNLEGTDPTSKPNDPAYIATVRDPTGYATLVYRSSNKCQPSNVKKGRYFMISGARCLSFVHNEGFLGVWLTLRHSPPGCHACQRGSMLREQACHMVLHGSFIYKTASWTYSAARHDLHTNMQARLSTGTLVPMHAPLPPAPMLMFMQPSTVATSRMHALHANVWCSMPAALPGLYSATVPCNLCTHDLHK